MPSSSSSKKSCSSSTSSSSSSSSNCSNLSPYLCCVIQDYVKYGETYGQQKLAQKPAPFSAINIGVRNFNLDDSIN